MIKAICWSLGMLIKFSIIAVILYILFCVNVLTMPLFLIALLFCKLFNLKKLHLGRYGLMFYPKWSYTPDGSFLADIKAYDKKTQAKVKKYKPYSFEEMYFYDEFFGD